MSAYTPTVLTVSPMLSGTTIDSITFPAGISGRVYVLNRGSADYLVTAGVGTAAGDVSAPSANADGTVMIPPGAGRYIHDHVTRPMPGYSVIVRIGSTAGGGRATVELVKQP